MPAAEPDGEQVSDLVDRARGGRGDLVARANGGGLGHAAPGTYTPRASGATSAARTLLFASASSILATAIDGVVYQVGLTVSRSHYGTAAFLGAIAGGAANFLFNRHITFNAQTRAVGRQLALYVVGSALTFVVLRLVLYAAVEGMGVAERAAWFPAKIVAWVAMSYPFQRWVVFARGGPEPAAVGAQAGSASAGHVRR